MCLYDLAQHNTMFKNLNLATHPLTNNPIFFPYRKYTYFSKKLPPLLTPNFHKLPNSPNPIARNTYCKKDLTLRRFNFAKLLQILGYIFFKTKLYSYLCARKTETLKTLHTFTTIIHNTWLT